MMDGGLTWGTVIAIAAAVAYIASCIRIVQEYERGVMFLLGRYVGLKQPGLRIVLTPVFRMRVVDLRLIAEDVPSQDVITRDNVSSRVNAVIYFRVVDPDKAVLKVENFRYATSQLAQTSLRSVVGAHMLDELLSERDKLNAKIQSIMDEQTDPWGIKVASVEIKHVDLPEDMRRVMARQAEAERERRARVIAAEGEFQAAQRMADAAAIIASQPNTLQLRYLQSIVQMATSDRNSTIIPIPLNLLDVLKEHASANTSADQSNGNGSRRQPTVP